MKNLFKFGLVAICFLAIAHSAIADIQTWADGTHAAAAANAALNHQPWAGTATLILTGLASVLSAFAAHGSRKTHKKLLAMTEPDSASDAGTKVPQKQFPRTAVAVVATVILVHVALISSAFIGTAAFSGPQVFTGSGDPNTNHFATNGSIGSMFVAQVPPAFWVKIRTNQFVQLYPQLVSTNSDFYSRSTNSTPLRIFCTGDRNQHAFEVYSNEVLTSYVDAAGDFLGNAGAFHNLQASAGAVIGGQVETDDLHVNGPTYSGGLFTAAGGITGLPASVVEIGSAVLSGTNLVTVLTTNTVGANQIFLTASDSLVGRLSVGNIVTGVSFDIMSSSSEDANISWAILSGL